MSVLELVEASRERMQAVLLIGEAIDLYVGDLARRGKRPSTRRTYRRLLNGFADSVAPKRFVHELELVDYERYLDRWTDAAPSTLASGVSLSTGFSTFLFDRGATETDIARSLKRPRRKRPEDLDVVTVSSEDVGRMLSACRNWQELLCLSTAVCLGARRAALARVRRGDVDLVHGTVRFLEKGGKVVVKPLPDEYKQLLLVAERDGLWKGPDDYLIPNRRPASVRRVERSDKVVWETVKAVARRAGVRSHVHALRAAFAVQFDDAHPAEVLTLKDLMGHDRLESTLIYLRRRDKARKMEAVRDLRWGLEPPGVLSSDPEEAHTGFEPVPSPTALPEPIQRKIDELRTKRAAPERET